MRSYVEKFLDLEGRQTQNQTGLERISLDLTDRPGTEEFNIDDFIAETAAEAEALYRDPGNDLWEDNRRKLLSKLVKKLDAVEIQEFIEDIFMEKEQYLSQLFKSTKWATTTEQAFDWLFNQPHDVKRDVADQFDYLFEKALRGHYGKNSPKVIDRILSITAFNRFGLSESYIKDVIENNTKTKGSPKINKQVELDLLIVLTKLENKPDAFYWEDVISLENKPYLGPAVIAAFSEQNPERSLSVYERLDQVKYNPTAIESVYFEVHSKWAIYNLLKTLQREALIHFSSLLQKIRTPWISDLLNGLLNTREFYQIKREIDRLAEASHRPFLSPLPLEEFGPADPIIVEGHELFLKISNRKKLYEMFSAS